MPDLYMFIGKFVPKLEGFNITFLIQQDPCHFEKTQKRNPASGVTETGFYLKLNSVRGSESQASNRVFIVSRFKAVMLHFISSC